MWLVMKDKRELKYFTYNLDMVYLNILSIVIFGAVIGVVGFLERNDHYLMENFNSGDFRALAILLVLMVFWLILHEIIHGIGFGLFKEVSKKNICFGMALEKGVFYCMCKQKISKKVILTSLLFPLTFIGIVTLIIGMIINSYTLVVLSVMNIAGAVGDMVMTLYFLKVSNDIIYVDLDDCTSFTVLSKEDLSSIDSRGVILKDSGIFNEDMCAKDKRRIVISKPSYMILIGLLVLAVIMFIVR